MRTSKPFIIVVSGPSGTGKTTLVAGLLQADPLLKHSISATTRAPRKNEIEGKDYFFKDRAEFEAMKKDQLVEWAEVHGFLYGTPRAFLEGQMTKGFDVVLNIDVQGGLRVKKDFPDAVLIFILPPSFGALETRIRGRKTDSDTEIEKRLDNARGELEAAGEYDYFVVNDTVEDAVYKLKAVVEAERCRRERYSGDFFEPAGG